MNWTNTHGADLESSWLYRALWVGALLTGYFNAYAQPDLSRSLPPLPAGYWLQLEEVTTHDSGDLEGLTTYRLYVNCLHPNDFVSSCSGDENNPLEIASSATPAWFNSNFATGWNAQGVNPAFLSFVPDIAYDSFLTIGADNSTYPTSQQCSGQWGSINVPEEFNEDGPGNSVLLNDQVGGAWYSLFPGVDQADSHPAFAGDDLRVLVAQLTTAGDVSGQIQIQIFQNGSQASEFRETLPIQSEGIPGCLDAEAFNFDPEANVADEAMCNYYCAEERASTPTCNVATWLPGWATWETRRAWTPATSTSTDRAGWTSPTCTGRWWSWTWILERLKRHAVPARFGTPTSRCAYPPLPRREKATA